MPEDLFADLRRRLDCRDLASSFGLRVGAARFQCANDSCPSHKHNRMTCSCDDGYTFTCQACGEWGDAVSLIQLAKGLSKKEAIEEAKRISGLDTDIPLPPPRKRAPPSKVIIGEADLSERLDALTIAEDHYDRLRREDERYLRELATFMTRKEREICLKWLRAARAYLKEGRGIEPKQVLPIKIGLVPAWRTGLHERLRIDGGEALVKAGLRVGLLHESKNGLFERYKGRIFIPWHGEDGRVCNAKGRAIPSLVKVCGLRVREDGSLTRPMDFLRTKDSDPTTPPHTIKPPLPFGWKIAEEMARERDKGTAEVMPIVVHEGEIDALSGMIAGVPSIATGGTSGVGVKAAKTCIKSFGHDRFTVIFDGDDAGRRGAKKLSILFRCPWNTLPDDTDCNDIFRSEGPAGVRHAISEAVANARHETPTPKAKPKPDETQAGEADEEELGMPLGWEMHRGHLCRMVPDPESEGDWIPKPTRIRDPPVICWRGRDVLDGSVVVGITGQVVGAGHSAEAALPRENVKNTRTIVGALAPHGFDVDSTTATTLVQFLSDYEHHFGERLAFKHGSKQMGWHGDSFLYGRDCYGPRKLSYIGEEVGILGSLDCAGTHEEWVEGVLRPLERYPLAMLGFYACMSAPLIHYIPGVAGFALEFAGHSSTGKSTASAAYASAWGNSADNGGLRRPFNDTAVGYELYSSLMNHLPIFMEDAHQMLRADPCEIVMMWANGMGKGRGKRSGQARQETRRWATVAVITGEGSIVSRTTFAGISARVISLSPPFGTNPDGRPDEELVEDIELMNRTRLDHYGHAGRLWVKWLVDGHIAEVMEAYNKWLPRMKRAATSEGPQQRWAMYLSAILATAEKAHAVIGGQDVIGMLLAEAHRYLSGTPAPDQAEDVLDMVLAWVAMDNQGVLMGDQSVASASQRLTWCRIMDDETVCIASAELDRRLRSEGIDMRQMRKVWFERGYLQWRGEPARVAKVVLAKGNTSCVPVSPDRAQLGLMPEQPATAGAESGAVH